ncbi:hypothetical protein EII25_03355 [Erysipelotrichaceae bacterium OH741_COT-311]|nr:hypothetical protein EII25_03355 [Erysipelotrichaceae bacterium OH741_COT-311]
MVNNEIKEKVLDILRLKEKNILLEEIKENTSIGVFFDSSNVIKKDIIGNETVRMTFSIFYKVDAKDTMTRLSASRKLNDIGAFIESLAKINKLPEIDEKRYFIKMEMISSAVLEGREDNGAYIYRAIYAADYRNKK